MSASIQNGTLSGSFDHRHLLSAEQLSAGDVRYLLDLARQLKQPISEGLTLQTLKGKTVILLFYEGSSRTRTSFELAIRKLGGSSFSLGSPQAAHDGCRPESLTDTARSIRSMKPHCLIVRHPSAGSPFVLTQETDAPIINAGDGFHQHPTQALMDALTLEDRLGGLRGKRILILGDIAHSRAARSNIQVLHTLGATVSVCGPPTLLPPNPGHLGVEHAFRPEPFLKQADAVITMRVQALKENRRQIPTWKEYSEFWGLNWDRFHMLPEHSVVIHPGDISDGVEIDPEVVQAYPNRIVVDQTLTGILIRSACLTALIR